MSFGLMKDRSKRMRDTTGSGRVSSPELDITVRRKHFWSWDTRRTERTRWEVAVQSSVLGTD